MEETILRSEAKKIIDSGELINIEYVTADRRRGIGGQYMNLKQWAKVKQKTPDQSALPKDIHTPKRDLVKDPHHGLNKTFNIHNPRNPSQHPQKVHYRLFVRLNGKTVIQ